MSKKNLTEFLRCAFAGVIADFVWWRKPFGSIGSRIAAIYAESSCAGKELCAAWKRRRSGNIRIVDCRATSEKWTWLVLTRMWKSLNVKSRLFYWIKITIWWSSFKSFTWWEEQRSLVRNFFWQMLQTNFKSVWWYRRWFLRELLSLYLKKKMSFCSACPFNF